MQITDPKIKEEYFSNSREDVLKHIHGTFKRSLDIGCANGLVSKSLLAKKIVLQADGLELDDNAYKKAKNLLSRVEKIDLCIQDFPIEMKNYDLVLCLDVLEHMVDPWTALQKIQKAMSVNGLLVVSLPNVANYRIILGLIRGDWRYEDSGILDKTHLRFFTRKTGAQLLKDTGFYIEKIIPTNMTKFSKSWWLNLFTFSLFEEQLIIQNLYFARPRRS